MREREREKKANERQSERERKRVRKRRLKRVKERKSDGRKERQRAKESIEITVRCNSGMILLPCNVAIFMAQSTIPIWSRTESSFSNSSLTTSSSFSNW